MNWPLPGETLASRPPEMTFDTFDPLPRDVTAAVRVILGLPPRDSGGDDVGADAVPGEGAISPGRDGGDTEPALISAAAAHPSDGGAVAKKRPAAAAVAVTGRRRISATAGGAGSDAGNRNKRHAAAGGNGAGTWV